MAGFDLPPAALIIDLSSNNGAPSRDNLPDWVKVKADDVDFAIIRSSMGSRGVDESFVYNIGQTYANGIGVATYHLFRPDSDGVPTAEHYLRTVLPYPQAFPYCVDVESVVDPQRILTPTQYADELARFVWVMRDATEVFPWVYTSLGEWEKLVGTQHDSLFAQCPLWVAHHTSAPTPLLPRCWSTYVLWQYSSHGKIDGIASERVDLNRMPPMNRFIAPADFPYVMSSGFNAPRHYPFALHRKQLHEGADFAPKKGAPAPYRVVAPGDGVITRVGFDKKGYGNFIVIDHGDGFTSWLAHLEAPPLKTSGEVQIGELVGYAGSTGGTSTGIHVHWTLQRMGKGLANYVVADVVDPLPYLMI